MSEAVLATIFDAGGTLFSLSSPSDAESLALQRHHLAAALGIQEAARLVALHEAFQGSLAAQIRAARSDGSHAQNPRAAIEEVLSSWGLEPSAEAVTSVWRALRTVAPGYTVPLPGAVELMQALTRSRIPSVIFSNSRWRVGVDYHESIVEACGELGIRGYITSAEVGYRKPHDRMFEAAMACLGVDASRCVVIGNSERSDIIPARRFGMRTVLVCIEEPRRECAQADAVLTSLSELPALLEKWS
jgi:HAD superfamily hydrolase (TIGR01509 family)